MSEAFEKAKAEAFRQWGVVGMPADKIRLANAMFDGAWNACVAQCAEIVDLRAGRDTKQFILEAIEKERVNARI